MLLTRSAVLSAPTAAARWNKLPTRPMVTTRTASTDKPTETGTFPFPRQDALEPAPQYKELRSACPIARAKLFDGSDIMMLTKHKHITQVLDDTRLSKERHRPGFPELSPGGKMAAASSKVPTFVDMDPPEHGRYRSMVEHAFTPEAVESMRPAIQKTTDELVDNMLQKKPPVDLVEVFAMPLPTKTIYNILGIPFEDFHFLSTNVAVRASASGTAKDASLAAQELMDYMDRLVRSKVERPGNDLISHLATRQLANKELTQEELVQTAFLLLVAGNATTVSLIALGVLMFQRHPDQLEQLKKDPSLMPKAVEELLRYHTASSFALRRVAKEPVEIDGQVLQPGEGLIALNQSANRDEEVFPEPDKFDINREPGPHLAFGYGRHVCVAQWLARAELQIALATLIKRVPTLKLAGPEAEVAEFSPPTKDIGITKLQVTW